MNILSLSGVSFGMSIAVIRGLGADIPPSRDDKPDFLPSSPPFDVLSMAATVVNRDQLVRLVWTHANHLADPVILAFQTEIKGLKTTIQSKESRIANLLDFIFAHHSESDLEAWPNKERETT